MPNISMNVTVASGLRLVAAIEARADDFERDGEETDIDFATRWLIRSAIEFVRQHEATEAGNAASAAVAGDLELTS